MAADTEAGHWLNRWPGLGQKGQGLLWMRHVLGDTSNTRLGEVVLTTCLEEAFQCLLWRKREAQGGLRLWVPLT